MNCQLEKQQVEMCIEAYGSPLYIFHESDFEENYKALLEAMQNEYPKYNIAYSFKTNYTPRICQKVKAFGGLAEVVSDMEYRLAKQLGYGNHEIIYNGPVKGSGLYEHLIQDGVANIDHLDELKSVIRFAKMHPEKTMKLAFRVNINIGQGFVSRFGLDAEENPGCESELDRAFHWVKQQPNLKIVGIHCHIGRSRSLQAWQERVRMIFRLIDRYFDDIPQFIDFGSGMNSVMEPSLAKQFGENIPSFDAYAEILAGAMQKRYGSLSEAQRPWLYTEPGTTLISGCMSFLGTIESIKTVKEKNFITFDCSGGNMGDICHLKNLPITVYHQGAALRSVSDGTFVGYTCLEHDHLYEGYNGFLAVGDVVQFRNVGSYSNVFKPPFILPNCAMVALCEDGHFELIKKAETMEDIFHTYQY